MELHSSLTVNLSRRVQINSIVKLNMSKREKSLKFCVIGLFRVKSSSSDLFGFFYVNYFEVRNLLTKIFDWSDVFFANIPSLRISIVLAVTTGYASFD